MSIESAFVPAAFISIMVMLLIIAIGVHKCSDLLQLILGELRESVVMGVDTSMPHIVPQMVVDEEEEQDANPVPPQISSSLQEVFGKKT